MHRNKRCARVAMIYSIISSALASSDAGAARLSALAVLRFMALDLAGSRTTPSYSPFSRPAPSVGEGDDFKIERQLIFVRSAERIGIDRSSTAREQRLLVSDATLTREGCKRIRQAVRQER